MKKSILLLAAGSLLLSGCGEDFSFVAPAPLPIRTSYSFTKAALEKCGYFENSVHYISSSKTFANNPITTTIQDGYGIFISAKDANGSRKYINYYEKGISSNSRYIEKAGTYTRSVRAGFKSSERQVTYKLQVQCHNTGEYFNHSANIERHSTAGYLIDVKDGKLSIDFRRYPSDLLLFDRPTSSKEEWLEVIYKQMDNLNLP